MKKNEKEIRKLWGLKLREVKMNFFFEKRVSQVQKKLIFFIAIFWLVFWLCIFKDAL